MHRSRLRPRLLWFPLLTILFSLASVAQALAGEQGGTGQPPPQFQPPPPGQPPQGGPPQFQPPPSFQSPPNSQPPHGGPGCQGPGGPGQGGPGGPGQSGPGPGHAGPGGGTPSSPPASGFGQENQAPGGPEGGPGCGPGGDFKSGFLNRVWKFDGEVDGYGEGVLSMTLAKVVNLPKRFKDQDDELVDQDTFVLLGQRTRVFDKEGKRVEKVARSEVDNVLGDAERVRVHGKMLRPDKWRKDEDDSPVPTIRAKKIYVVG